MTDVFLCAHRRTPIGRHGGSLATVRPDDLAAHVIDGLLDLHPGLAVDEVILGCANQAGEDNRNVARMAVLLSRLPESVPGLTVNRLCASGLDAVIAGARAVRDGADVVIAGGVESMTRAPFVLGKSGAAFSRQVDMHDTTIGWRFVNDRIARAYGCESMNLGASRWETMKTVTIPWCAPSIAAALAITAAVSFDEFMIAWFVSGLEETLPVRILALLQGQVSPRINAIGSVVFFITILLAGVAQLFAARGRKTEDGA